MRKFTTANQQPPHLEVFLYKKRKGNMKLNENKQIIIAGPCALESREHAQSTVRGAGLLGISILRLNLWKPRTRPGFEGVGEKGIPWIQEVAEQGFTPAMEVITPQQADVLMEAVLAKFPHAALVLWIGSRNQNHLVQREIGQAVAGESRVSLMLKNQPWRDQDHWEGMAEHVQNGGATKEQLVLCHRGFAPQEKANSELRNVPDVEMALRVKEKLGLPLVLDPSHIGGKSALVKNLVREFSQIPEIDGQIIEVHPEPSSAATDTKQQLSWSELQELLEKKV